MTRILLPLCTHIIVSTPKAKALVTKLQPLIKHSILPIIFSGNKNTTCAWWLIWTIPFWVTTNGLKYYQKDHSLSKYLSKYMASRNETSITHSCLAQYLLNFEPSQLVMVKIIKVYNKIEPSADIQMGTIPVDMHMDAWWLNFVLVFNFLVDCHSYCTYILSNVKKNQLNIHNMYLDNTKGCTLI